MTEPTTSHRITRVLLFGYLSFLVYGSLYPVSSFRLPDENPLALVFGRLSISRTDALANLLVYLPLGWLLAAGVPGIGLARAGLLGCALSFTIEYLQAYLPGRVPSVLDWGLNTAGAFLGAALGSRFHHSRWLETGGILVAGARARLGLLSVSTWAASQLFPFVPSVDVDALKEGLRPVWHALRGQASFSFSHAAEYALATLALSLILRECLRPNPRHRYLVPAAFLAVLFAKVPIVSRQLSLEALGGSFLGLAVSRRLGDSLAGGSVPLLAAAGSFVIEEIRVESGAEGLQPFNWIPLKNSLTNELIGAADILATAWPFLAMAYVARGFRPAAPRRAALAGAAAIFAAVLALEGLQRLLPGRTPDVTDAIVAAGAWLVGWLGVSGNDCASDPRPDREGRSRSAGRTNPPRSASR